METQTQEWEPRAPEDLETLPEPEQPPQDDTPDMGHEDEPAPQKDDREKLMDVLLDQNRQLQEDIKNLKTKLEPQKPQESGPDPLQAMLDQMGLKDEDRDLFERFGSALLERAKTEFLPRQYEPLLGQMSVSMADWNALQQHGGAELSAEQQQKAQAFINERRGKGTGMSAEELAEWAVDRVKASPSPTAEARKAKLAASQKAGMPQHRSVNTTPNLQVTDEELEQMPYEQRRALYDKLYAGKAAG